MKRKKLKITIILLFTLLAVSVICIIKGLQGDDSEYTIMNIKYKDLELNRTKIYLPQGVKYDLNLQPDSYKTEYGVYIDDTLQEALREDTKWKSSDDDIATVDEDGIVTAVSQGEALITVRLRGETYDCEIQVLPEDTDMEIPILYCNDIFNEELYHQIDKIQLLGTTEYSSGDLKGMFEMSSVYSMLAECKEFQFERDYTGEDKYLAGLGGIFITLKDGETVELYIAGSNEIIYQNKFYHCYYGEDSSYGKSFALSEEIVGLLHQLRKKEHDFWR